MADEKNRTLSGEFIPAGSSSEPRKLGEPLANWPDSVAAMPTELTRTSLFRLVRRGCREKLTRIKLESRGDVELTFTGTELDQADADLWLACLRLGRGTPLGQEIFTTRAQLLRGTGRGDSGCSRKWLDESLTRMGEVSFKVRYKRNGGIFSVMTGLLKWEIEEANGRMSIQIDPKGALLFQNLAYLDWETRLSLSSNATKAIYTYVCGHQSGQTHSVRVVDLAAWCGYQGRPRDFRISALKPALEELQAKGVLENARVEPGQKRGAQWEVASWIRTGGRTLPRAPKTPGAEPAPEQMQFALPFGDRPSVPTHGSSGIRPETTTHESDAPPESHDRDTAAASPRPTLPKPRGRKASSTGGRRPAVSTGETWEAYREAYQRRYRVEPVRNATVNGQLAGVLKRLGAEAAPAVAAFYVSHNSRFYVQKKHPVGLLLSDAEGLHTEWATNSQVTESDARQTDRRQAQGQVWRELIAESRAKRAENEAKARGCVA